MKPDVSVLIPVYNGERYLRAAIDSILGQTHRNFELLVIDDGSRDRSREIASGYADDRIRVIALAHNGGLSNALNEGVAAAQAPLIARQDQDDISEPIRLERQLAFLDHHATIALVGSQGTVVNDAGGVTGEVRRPTGRASLLWFSIFDNPFVHTSIVARTEVLRRVGGYDSAYDPFAQDYELWGRIMQSHEVANLDEALVRYRVNDASTMGNIRDEDRRRFNTVMQELTVRQAQRVLGESAAGAPDGPLLAGVVGGLEPHAVRAFLGLFERLLTTFLSHHTPDREDDFSSTLARQFDALSYRVRPPSRESVMRIYSHLLRHHPDVMRHISWTRTLALLLAGRAGRDRLGQWWRS